MIELFKGISLDKDAGNPLYVQLYETLRNAIASGVLLAGFRLPSVRKLAEVLRVNQVTVVSAFKRLESEGYIYSRPGSGTYVAEVLPDFEKAVQPASSPMLDEIYNWDDVPLINNGQIKINEGTINFASATPTADLFPVEDFKVVLNEVLERDKGNAFGYQESQGYYPIRESISHTLNKSGISCNPEFIQIISGAQQGIDIISKALLRQGDCIITESPTYTGAIAVFKSRQAQIVDVQIDEDGPDLNVLEYNLKKYRPRLIFIIPSFQNPTGCSCPNDKRRDILKLAERYNAYIIEDDYVSELDFEDRNFIPIKSMDENSRVIFIKSFSKIFMPGLRLGFMIVPPGLLPNILEAKHSTDISTSGLIQRAFDLYIRKGFWDKHFKYMYDIYKNRYLKITGSLDRYLPAAIQYLRPGGGLNIWLSFSQEFMVNKLVKHAAAHDIVFAPGRIFYSGASAQKINNIRLSFASVHTGQIEPGIKRLCEVIDSLHYKDGAARNLPVL